MARTRKRKDGRYQQSLRYEGRRYFVYGRTTDECDREKANLMKMLQAHCVIPERNIKLGKFYKQWQDGRAGEVSKATQYRNGITFKRLGEELKEKKIREITKQEIILLRQELIGKGLCSSTVNDTITLLKTVLKAAVDAGIIIKNPADGIRQKKRTEEQMRDTVHRALSEEEIKLFFKYAQNDWYYELYAFLYATGMRTSEAAALTWADINEVKGTINIDKTITQTGSKEYQVGPPKTKTSKRVIPLTDNAKRALITQKEKMFAIGGSGRVRMEERIFTPIRGSILTPSIADRSIKIILNRIRKDGKQIDHFAAHAFRDTFATEAIKDGMQPNTLKGILGHASLSMTMDLYAHSTEEMKQEAMMKLNIGIA